MVSNQSNGFSNGQRRRPSVRYQRQAPGKTIYATIYQYTLGWMLKKLWQGLCKLAIALRYRLQRSGQEFFGTWRLSWFKLALAGLVLFIITKKDIQFSINMKAPLRNVEAVNTSLQQPGRSSIVEELAVVPPISRSTTSSKTTQSSRKATPAPPMPTLDPEQVDAYVRRFTKVAQAEMRKFGIPASIKMAQAILESQAGTNKDAHQYNNHFGAPLQAHRYESAWENWRTHSMLLRAEYPQLFENGSDYKKWAKGLQVTGYNTTDQRYGQHLIAIIEQYRLQILDEI
jgi:hypothetical protein